jgi:hypothetical protein
VILVRVVCILEVVGQILLAGIGIEGRLLRLDGPGDLLLLGSQSCVEGFVSLGQVRGRGIELSLVLLDLLCAVCGAPPTRLDGSADQ